MEIKYIDIHSHLNLPPLSETKEVILAKMRELGIATITVGTGLVTSKEAVKIAEENPGVCFATVGIHPCDIPSPTLPKGKGVAPGYLTGSGQNLEALLQKAKEMRNNPTKEEEILWNTLKGDKLGYHFRQQHVIEYFIADFVCLNKKLIIEVDGEVHTFQQERDKERDEILIDQGFKILRFSNKEIESNLEYVLEEIKRNLEEVSGGSLPFGKGWGWDELCDLANHPSVVAIGETGLDYFRDQSDETKQKQAELFKKHIELAVKVNKPLMLHVRASKGSNDAYYDALEILKTYASGNFVEGGDVHFFEPGIGREQSRAHTEKEISANFHFFSGSKECMEKIVDAGYTISVDGPITFSHDYDDMIRAVPLEKIMIETDAPFAAPAPYRGKPCEPWMVIEVAKKIAELKNLDLEHVRIQLLENAKQFFALDL